MHSLDLQMFDAFLGFGAAGEQGVDGVMVWCHAAEFRPFCGAQPPPICNY